MSSCLLAGRRLNGAIGILVALTFSLLLASFLRAAPGDVDTGFDPNANNIVSSVAVQPDGKILLGGDFTSVGGTVRNHIARVNADGTLDTGFDPSADNSVFSIAVQADGKILFGGNFFNVGGTTRHFIARLNADGTLDTGFHPILTGSVDCIAMQADGKIVLGGAFTSVGGVPRNAVARLNANGTLDTGFDPNANSGVLGIAIQVDGKILLGGEFTSVSGTTRNHMARVNADGTLDTGFDPNANGLLWSLALQADGKILLGGQFTSVGGATCSHIGRVNADGTLDTGFAPNTNNADVTGIAVQADGKLLLSGGFVSVDGWARNGLARVNTDGTLDTNFAPNLSGGVFGLAVQADGKILLVGPLTSAGGIPRNHIARLANDAATQTLVATSATHVEWLRGGAAPEVSDVTFELSTNSGATWTSLGNGTRISGGWELTGLALPASGSLRARGRTSSGGFASGNSGLVEQVQAFPTSAPVVTAPTSTGVTATAATLGGEVTFDGNSAIIERGVVYAVTATNAAPQIGGNGVAKVTVAGTTGVFATNAGDLAPGTSYNYAAYATNAIGTTYTDVATFTTPPAGMAAALGGDLSLSAPNVGSGGSISYEWHRNGAIVTGATNASLDLSNVQSSDTGLYSVDVSDDGVTTSSTTILGLSITGKVAGDGDEIGSNILHPNGNIFDQVLLTGVAETITADPGQVTRTSYIDLNDEIVQVEFSGAGSLSLVLDDPTGPALPVNYNQNVDYMKGHAGIVIAGADETTNVSVFSVGRATAFDPTGAYNFLLPPSPTNNPANNGSPLFQGHDATRYNGVADIAFIAILSTDGKFGGVRTANANYFAHAGLTGVYAPGVAFQGPVYIGNIEAFDAATPVIQVGSVSDARITGGDLSQDNGAAVQVSGLTQLHFTAGADSNGTSLPTKTNQAVLEQDGQDVTAQIVAGP